MKRLKTRSFLLIFLFALSSPSTARDTITQGKPLLDGDTLVSSGENFALGFFSPVNSTNRYIGVWYNKITIQTIVWVANRNNPILHLTGTLSVTTDGRLAVVDQNSKVIWSTAATSLANPVAQLLDNGNLVVREETNTSSARLAWQSFDYPTDTLIPGMKLGRDLTAGLTRNLTAWKNEIDPSPSRYCLAMAVDGDPEMLLLAGSTKVWRSGRWDGHGFSSIFSGNATSFGFNFSVINNIDEVSFSFTMSEPREISRVTVAQSGVMQVQIWAGDTGWNVIANAPKDECDVVGSCGPFSTCNASNSPICGCLSGFTPKNPTDWALRDWTDGCIRKTELDCQKGTDGVKVVSNIKLPDNTSSLLQLSLDLEQCKAVCLLNCSCTAYASADSSNGGAGCLFWYTELTDIEGFANPGAGQDLYLRLAAAADLDLDLPLDAHNRKSMAFPTWVIIVVAIIVLASLSGLGFYLRRRKKKKTNGRNGVQKEDDFELPTFDFKYISDATNNFSISNKLGEGGFGPVYKGKLGQDQDIAVKRLAKTSMQGSDEFRTEVMLIAKLQHKNLVRLLGCCIQGDEKMLIYEYMPNKSLDAFIFEKGLSALLDWQTRYRIILGIARGLLYLHQDSRFRIIHRDLKANNILLDKEMNPKISDFGLARISREDESEINTRRIVGTYGYMSPEYAMDGIFSVKSDVYSFGVLILEIITGKKNRGVYSFSPDSNLVIHMWNLWNEGNVTEVVDESMGESFPVVEVLKCIKVGLLCVQERPEYRPLISEVIQMLGNSSTPLPEPKEPGFIVRRGPVEVHSASSKQPGSNGLTITMSEVGR